MKNQVAGWVCPRCGTLTPSQVDLGEAEKAAFNSDVDVLTPRCLICKEPISFRTDGATGNAQPSAKWGRVLVIGGPCASGKTSVSHELAVRHSFVQIDGDWIIWQLKKELGRAASLEETHVRALALAEGIVALGRDVALAHVVLPENVPLYVNRLQQLGIAHAIVILMPTPRVVQERNISRPCWTTPDEWMERFYSDYVSAPDHVKVLYHDSSDETIAETVQHVLQRLGNGVDHTPH